jgi:hypothetical protein
MQIRIRDLVNPGSWIENVGSSTLLRLGCEIHVNLQKENEKKTSKRCGT